MNINATNAINTKRAEKLDALTADIQAKGITTPIDWLTAKNEGTKVTPLTRDAFYVLAVINGKPTVNESGEDITGYAKYTDGLASIIRAVRSNSYGHAVEAFKSIAIAIDLPEDARTLTKADFTALTHALINVGTINDTSNDTKVAYTIYGIKAGATTKNNFERWLFVRTKNNADYKAAMDALDGITEKNVNTKDYKKMLKSYGELTFKSEGNEKKGQLATDKKVKIQEAGKKLGYTDEKISVDLQNAINTYKAAHTSEAPTQPDATVTVPEGLTSANDRAATDKKEETTAA